MKPFFLKYNLVSRPKELLLGASRIDIAALVTTKTICDNLNPNGKAYFYLPLSLFLNEGAHKGFRQFHSKDTFFALKEFYDFHSVEVFTKVQTRYGLVYFEKNIKQKYPIPCHIFDKDGIKHHWAAPSFNLDDPLSVKPTKEKLATLFNFSKLTLPKKSKPRQGANTCGANSYLIFTDLTKKSSKLVEVNSKEYKKVVLPSKYLYPLLSRENFKGIATPQKYILLFYNEKTGKPLPYEKIVEPEAREYLEKIQQNLLYRKGIMLKTMINRGFWWALLGVGQYSFAPYKVVWEAYGTSSLNPEILSEYKGQYWQGNQALHAYIPAYSLTEAKKIAEYLRSPQINEYMQSFRMSGTRSWAQPGKISKLFLFEKNTKGLKL